MGNKIEQFEDFKLNRQLFNAVDDLGYSKPTAIQRQAIPAILAGHDTIGIAQTGTGKTAAYLLPLLYKIKYAQGEFPRALILAPSKELTIQIFENLEQLSTYCGTRNICLYGGIGPKTQIEQLERGCDIVVSTPGRFLELYRKGSLVVKKLNLFVLDEADKMMDMGFAPQIRDILEKIPRKRQNLLFSATFPEKVQAIADEFLEFPHKIEVTPQSTKAETIEHYFYKTPNLKTKINLLSYLLEDPGFSKVMIFTRTKENANNIFKFLNRKLPDEVRVIHANKSQNSRINAFNDFRAGEVRILVSTDVSARGLDIYQVSHVINFDIPRVYEEYVHRIGRTGRAEQRGMAISFANEAEEIHIEEIEKVISEKISERILPAEVEPASTDKEEAKQIALEIDRIKRIKYPEYKGAFHEKKKKPKVRISPGKKKKKSGR
ncbi:MAG: DEAD/DEAH box helicase [Cytophagales bacterium]|nr:DEAD/DEAH box helicase [Cytophagales bacterium]